MDATQSRPTPPRGNGIWLWILLAIGAAGAFAYLTAGRSSEVPSGTESPAIGRALPFLHLEGLTGDAKPVSLDDLRGHVTLMNYWGPWCGYCVVEFPHLVDLAGRFSQDEEFRIYAVSSDGGRDTNLDSLRQQTEQFLKSQHSTLPIYADPDAASRRAMITALGLDGFGFPTTLVLDRQGKVRGLWIGYKRGSERAMQSLIEQLLAKPAAEPAA